MLVFDVCNKASFDKLGTWMKEARVHGAPSSMCYVVGVKGWPYHRKLGMATSFWPYECGHAATSVDRTICMVRRWDKHEYIRDGDENWRFRACARTQAAPTLNSS